MKLFRINPTIRETNKYLSETTEILLKKHGMVSSEEFEKDLVEKTGIGWKQVKNYKNHPKPGDRLKDNAVVLKFVVNARARDTKRKVRRTVTVCIGVIAVAYTTYHFAMIPKKIEQFIVHEAPPKAFSSEVAETRIFLTVPSKDWLFRLGPLEHSRIPINMFTCFDIQGTGTKNCSFRGPSTEATLILDGNFVRRYSLLSFEPEDISNLKEQLVNLLGEKIDRFPANDKQLDALTIAAGNESINLQATGSNSKMRAMLSVTVSLK